MNLGYFDALADKQIQPMDDGRKVFYPLGKWLGGYIVPSNEVEQIIRSKIKVFTICLIGLPAVCFPVFGDRLFAESTTLLTYLLLIVVLSLLATFAAHLFYLPVTCKLERITKKEATTPISTSSAMANKMHPALILTLWIVCFVFTFLSIWFYFSSGDSKMLVGAVFFGLLCIPYTKSLYKKMSK